MTLKHILAMDTISTLKDKKSYERFQNLLDEVIISAEKNRVLFIAWIGKKTKINRKITKILKLFGHIFLPHMYTYFLQSLFPYLIDQNCL